MPDRPKYILLFTDERQEAPKDSQYYSSTYTPRHRLLEYVKKVDMGQFRVITIGYGLSARIELDARTLMTTLAEPPARPQEPLAGSSGVAATTGDATSSAPAAPGTAPDTAPGTITEPVHGRDEVPGASSTGVTGTGFAGAPLAAALAAASAAGIIIAILIARRKRGGSTRS